MPRLPGYPKPNACRSCGSTNLCRVVAKVSEYVDNRHSPFHDLEVLGLKNAHIDFRFCKYCGQIQADFKQKVGPPAMACCAS